MEIKPRHWQWAQALPTRKNTRSPSGQFIQLSISKSLPKSLAILVFFLAKLEKSNSNSLAYGLANFPSLPSTGGSRAYLRAVGDLPSRELPTPPPLARADGTFTRARDYVDRAGVGASRRHKAQDPPSRRPRGHLLEPRLGGDPVAALQLRRYRTTGDGWVRSDGELRL